MNRVRLLQIRARWLLALAPCLLSGAGDVASTGSDLRSSNDEATQSTAKLEKFVVSANHMALNAASITSPVEIVTADEISRSGIETSIQEALRKIVPQFMGNGNAGAEFGGASSGMMGGGSSLALRNLSTLVLINGRRAAVSPVSAHHTGREFVDLNVIPLAAIRSIAINRGGGSAIHGMDAVGGVVNITISSALRGGTLGGSYEVTPGNGGWERRGANFVFGHEGARTLILIAGGWSRQDPLWKDQRSFSNPTFNSTNFNGSVFFGSHFFVLNPALAAPPLTTPKPAVAFPMTNVPVASDGRQYFGPVDSDAVYWGKLNAAGEVIGFGSAELAQGSSPEAARVAFNVASWVTLLQRRDSRSGFIVFERTLREGLTAFADILAARIATQSQVAPQGFGDTVLASNPNNPFATPIATNSRVLTSPRPSNWDTNYGRLVIGLRGQFGDRFRFETALNLNRSRLTYLSLGQISLTAMRAAIAEGRLNVFQRVLPSEEVAAAEFVGAATGDFDSTLYAWDGMVSFEAFRLPGGALEWTIGGEHRREKLKGTADQFTVPDALTGRINWGGGQPLLPFGARRSVSSVFAAVRAPVIAPARESTSGQSFDLTFDARGEQYSDTSDSLVSAVGVRWMPWGRGFTVRANVGRLFNAPTLYQTSGPPLPGNPVVDIVAIDGRPAVGPAHAQSTSSSALEPERARNMSVGIVYVPRRWKKTKFELNYLRVSQRGIIRRLPPRDVLQDVELRGPESRYVAGHAGSLPGYDVRLDTGFAEDGAKVTAPGQIASRVESVFLTNPSANLGDSEVRALDAAIACPINLNAGRSLDLSLRVAYTASHVFMGIETAGRATPSNGTIPRWRTITMVAYRHGDWQFNLLHRAIASVYAEVDRFETGGYQYFDVGVKRRLGGFAPAILQKIELSITIKNVGDASPRRAPGTFSGSTADLGTYDPLGRTYLFSTNFRF